MQSQNTIARSKYNIKMYKKEEKMENINIGIVTTVAYFKNR